MFDRNEYDHTAEKFGKVTSTFRDYADMNMHYLQATGMVQSKGKGIALIPEKRALAVELTKELLVRKSLLELLSGQVQGKQIKSL